MPNRGYTWDGFPTLEEQQTQYPKYWISFCNAEENGIKQYKWSCLRCGYANKAKEESLTLLASETHSYECTGNVRIAAARFDLLQAIVSADRPVFLEPDMQNHFGIGLIQRGGLWRLMADLIGWPKGYNAEDGWYSNYDEVFKDFNLEASFEESAIGKPEPHIENTGQQS